MAWLEDRRPTLASWPKRIYEWPELPEVFRPALGRWRQEGLPPGNVTYIPRVNQYASSPEYAVAWRPGEVMVQTARRDGLEVRQLRPEEVAQVKYRVELLRCQVTVYLRDGGELSFPYNKTKEELLLPVLDLLLGNAPDYAPPAAHAPGEAWERLRRENYAMYYTSLLCCRYGGEARSFTWFRGKEKNLLYILKKAPDPEYFLGEMDRGLAVVSTDFYGVQARYLPWEGLRLSPPEEGAAVFRGEAPRGPALEIPLLPGQDARVRAFLEGLAEHAGSR